MEWTESLVKPLGWTLLHFLWQGALIGLLHEIALHAWRRSRPATRYFISLSSMVALAAAPLLTFLSQWDSPTAALPGPAPVTGQAEAAAIPASTAAVPLLEIALPWIVAAWLAGVLLMSARFGLGVVSMRQLLRQADYEAVCERMQQQLAELGVMMGVRRKVQLALSTQISSPLVVGWLKPVIMLPLSAVTGLDHQQLRMVFAHELAHIRRHDHLVNLFQVILETLFFYHPAVHRVSESLRQEREACCDEMAASVSGNRLAYARVLAELEALRQDSLRSQLALGIADQQLYTRIERLVRDDTEGHQQRWLPVIALLLAGTLGAGQTLDFDAPLLPAWFEQASSRQRIALTLPPAMSRGEFRPIREQDEPPPAAIHEQARVTTTSPERVTETLRSTPAVEEKSSHAMPALEETATEATAPPLADEAAGVEAAQDAVEEPAATIIRGGQLLHAVEPAYPRRALRAGTEGHVELAFTIAADGSVTDAEVVRAAPRGQFENAALAAISQWKYAPFTENGVPVARRASQVLEFRLSERSVTRSSVGDPELCREQTGTRLCRAVEDLSTELRVIREAG